MTKVIRCPKCHTSLPPERLNTSDLTTCPFCGVTLRIDVFPAFFKGIVPGQPGETLLVDTEASCFYHPQKKAVIPCESCGRFLCALCDVELHGQHLCPNCLETGKKKGNLKSLENHRTLYDSIALRLSLYSMIFLWPNLIAAPIALFIAIRYRNAPSSLVARTRIRLIMAIILSSLQMLGWGMVFYFLLML